MRFAVQLVVAGMSIGAIYALIAQGFNITYRTVKVINFAHGSFLMIAVMAALALHNHGAPLWVALAAAALLTVALGFVFERVAVRPVVNDRTGMGWVVSGLGAGVILQAVATDLWGAKAMAFPPVVFASTDYLTVGDTRISLQLLMVFVTSVAAMIVMEVLMEHTMWGRAMKATAFDNEPSKLVGINTTFMVMAAFGISGLLAAVAGLLVAPITGVDPGFGLELMMKGFVAAVIGGMGSSMGALAGGLFVGVLEMLVDGYVSSAMGSGIVYGLMIPFLVLRPNGFFGKEVAVKL